MNNRQKINQLLRKIPQGSVILSSWLVEKGYSYALQQRYKKSGWFTSIGIGAMVRAWDEPDLYGALYALQLQAGYNIHLGAKSALAMLGKVHYLPLGEPNAELFLSLDRTLPTWFLNYAWEQPYKIHTTHFIPDSTGLQEYEVGSFNIIISNAERAILECLYLCNDEADIVESYQLLEGLNTLRPNLVQSLLESCKSIKVKRLFLFIAERIHHAWFDSLDISTIDLGAGKRSIIKGGLFVPKYDITIPKALTMNEITRI